MYGHGYPGSRHLLGVTNMKVEKQERRMHLGVVGWIMAPRTALADGLGGASRLVLSGVLLTCFSAC